MRLIQELNAIAVEPDEYQQIQNTLINFTSLGPALAKCRTTQCVAKLMLVELTSRRRLSYIQRIYGRYRRLQPDLELEEVLRWAKLKES